MFNILVNLYKYRHLLAISAYLIYLIYLISTLYGEIHRCNNTTSNAEDLKCALDNLKKLAIKNGYPTSLVDEKIMEVEKRNFTSKEGKTERVEEISKHPERNFNLVLTYTNDRCSKITKKINNLIRNITPNYNLSIIWSNDKISKLYSPRLKLGVPFLQKAGTVYNFKCDCGSEYVGETKRALRKRIMEHHQLKKNTPSPIYKHIYVDKCICYSFNLAHKFGGLPSKAKK